MSLAQYFVLKTFDRAFTGNKNLLSVLLFFHFPFLLLPRREAHHRPEQCNAGAHASSTFWGSESSFYTLFSFKDQKMTSRKKNFNCSSNHIFSNWLTKLSSFEGFYPDHSGEMTLCEIPKNWRIQKPDSTKDKFNLWWNM